MNTCTCTGLYEEPCTAVAAHITDLAARYGDSPILRAYVAGIQASRRCQRTALAEHARMAVK